LGDRIKGYEIAGNVLCRWEKRNAYRILVGKPEGKIPLGRLRHRWEDNIEMDLK
jgi:hypothetical protein